MNKITSLIFSTSFKYFLFHPYLYIIFKLKILFLKYKREAETNTRDNTKIDIFIPCGLKDIPTLSLTIQSIQKHVMHTINMVYIVSPDNEKVRQIAKQNNAVWIDEKSIAPIDITSITYTTYNHVDRSSWLYQQLIKLSCTRLSKNRFILVQDADTILIRNQKYIENEHIVINCSSNLPHIPYFNTYYKLLRKQILPIYNTTSHSACIDRKVLEELKNKLEKYHSLPWYRVIINYINKNEFSYISDYELYGQYLIHNKDNKIILKHWKNNALPRSLISNLDFLEKQYDIYFKSISFHSYLT